MNLLLLCWIRSYRHRNRRSYWDMDGTRLVNKHASAGVLSTASIRADRGRTHISVPPVNDIKVHGNRGVSGGGVLNDWVPSSDMSHLLNGEIITVEMKLAVQYTSIESVRGICSPLCTPICWRRKNNNRLHDKLRQQQQQSFKNTARGNKICCSNNRNRFP